MKIVTKIPMTLHQFNLRWKINHISQPFLQGYEIILEDGSIHWAPKDFIDKTNTENEKTITTRLPTTLA